MPHRHPSPAPAPATRKPLRLARFDYSSPGAYFVTIVTQGRTCRFGTVVAGALRLNTAGRMVSDLWQEISSRHMGVSLDDFVVMPNHVHGIIVLADPDAGTPSSLAQIVGAWKSRTTVRYGEGVLQAGWPPFDGQLWQRRFHDHVVRDAEDLGRIREYIRGNPARWCVDRDNPRRGT